MTQTLALLLDAYRELNAKKLFWITMVLSGLVAASFFLVGINETGLKLVFWQLDLPFFNTQEMTTAGFYKMIFSSLAIRFWLGIAATVLAIISTASFFPDLCKEGSIDLMLSKPISRIRLFLTRYCTGLLFAFMQVFAFTFICFLVIGIRGGVWEPGLFLAVPFFVLFFSYLFAISALVGVLTRSTVAALLITLLVFVLLIGLNTTDVFLRAFNVSAQIQARIETERVTFAKGLNEEDLAELEDYYGQTLSEMESDAAQAEQMSNTFAKIDSTIYLIKWPLPKTGETLELLERAIISAADLPEPEGLSPDPPAVAEGMRSEQEIADEALEELERPIWWIVGTSVAFELILLSIAGWKFCSRDY